MKINALFDWLARAGTTLLGALLVASCAATADIPAPRPSAENFLKGTNPPAALRDEALKLATQYDSLTPQDAARQWLGLALALGDLRQIALGEDSPARDRDYPEEAATAIKDALPPPAVWKELPAALSAIPPTTNPQGLVWREHLKIIIAILNNDRPALNQIHTDLEKKAAHYGQRTWSPSTPAENEDAVSIVDDLQNYLLDTSNDLAVYRAQIRQALADPGDYYDLNEVMDSCDLVALYGRDEAGRLLTPLIVSGQLNKQFYDPPTLAFAAEIALNEIKRLKSPLWNLANGDGGVALFDALANKFGYPRGNRDQDGFDEAAQKKLAALITAGKVDEAFALADTIQAGFPFFNPQWDLSARGGLNSPAVAKQIADHLLAHARAKPADGAWAVGLPFAVAAGEGDAWLAEMDQARQHATGEDASFLNREYRDDLLVFGRDEPGLALWRQEIAAAAADYASSSILDGGVFEITKLADAARLLKKTDLLDEILREYAAIASKSANSYFSSQLAEMYFHAGRPADAVSALNTAMSLYLAEQSNPNRAFSLGGSSSEAFGEQSFAATALTEIASLHAQAGQWAEVIELLDQAPQWGVDDLRDLLTQKGFNTALGVVAAQALFHTGRADDARRVLYAYLDRAQQDDRAYELLLEMDGAAALPKLAALAQLNPYEARPLIWEGVILLRQGQAADAEQVLRRAIALDPSDGESGPGDRLRADDVLAQALDALGRADDAKVYHNAVQAVRLAEQADDVYHAGLVGDALQMYRDALGIFPDDYYTQLHLAKVLFQTGHDAEATLHYERAFALMPASFGRRESLGAGCENVFVGPLAEKILVTAVQQNPALPQNHYLLGRFYANCDRYEEAVANYEQAVKLDPLYLNAWRGLLDNVGFVPAHAARANAVALTLARLSPGGLDYRTEAGCVTDLAELWNIAEEKTTGNAARDTAPVYPLAASAGFRVAHPVHNHAEIVRYGDPASNTPARIIFTQGILRSLWDN